MTAEEEKRLCHEFDLLVERRGKLIELLCQRASYGRRDYYSEMKQECYMEILAHLERRLAATERQMPEPQWVWGQCRSAISHYKRSLRFRSTLPLGDREPPGAVVTHEVTQLTVDELAACLRGAERRCFLLMADGADDAELMRQLRLKPDSLRQLKYNIRKTLYEYIKQ